MAYVPSALNRALRFLSNHASGVYLGTIAISTAALLSLGVAYGRQAGASSIVQVGIVLLLLLPASDVAISCIQRLIARLIPPKRLPRLDFSAGVPESARTMVIVPTMLTSAAGVDALLTHIEVLALGNLDPCVHFAILTDFADAGTRATPGDAAILERARTGVQTLNLKLGADHADRFFLFHRARQWNVKERVWMGWERKRGKIEEFNRLLRGATDTSFSTQVGNLDVLPSVRYCITLDSDTLLPRDAARQLIGIIEHPLNRPRFDAAVGRVTEGYGILQPRVSVTMSSAAGSLFARTYAGHTGVDPYTTAVSDVYQDLFNEGIFTGKGLYDVDAFIASLEHRVPVNALLSHDLFEGLYARTALVTDVELVDDYPSSVLAHARRQHRWVRGDWQILWWLLPFAPSRSGLKRNRLPLLARWKILDNLRRSLLPPAAVALLLARLERASRGPRSCGPLAGLASLALPIVFATLAFLAAPRPNQSWLVHLRGVSDDLTTAAARSGFSSRFWQTKPTRDCTRSALRSFASASRNTGCWSGKRRPRVPLASGAPQFRTFVKAMLASPVLAIGGVRACRGRAPGGVAGGASDSRRVGDRTGHRVRLEPPGTSPADRADSCGS